MARVEPAWRPWLLAFAALALVMVSFAFGAQRLPEPWPRILDTLLLTALLVLLALIVIDASFGEPIGITRWAYRAFHTYTALFAADPGALWLGWARKGPYLAWNLDCLHRSARKGNLEGMREYGRHFLDGGMGVAARGAALPWFRRAAEAGDAPAAYFLAEMLRWGVGTQARPIEAQAWYLRAAQQGYRPAALWLAQAFELGEGVEKDPAKAQQWARRAETLEGGERPDPHLLALPPPPEGRGATAREIYDEVGGALWGMRGFRVLVVGLLLALALAFLVVPALRVILLAVVMVVMLTALLYRLMGHRTRRASRSGKTLAARAEAGDPVANFELGLRLEKGHHELPKDTVQARIHYARAADAGHAQAAFHLADLLSWGMGGPADAAQARLILERLARTGHPEAAVRLQRLGTGLSPGPASADQDRKGEAP